MNQKLGFYLTLGTLLPLAMLLPWLSFTIWFALIPLLLIIQTESWSKSILSGLIMGGMFFLCFFYWIIFYELRIFLIVIIFTIPFFILFTLFVKLFFLRFHHTFIHILAPPLAWSAISFLYSLTPLRIVGNQIALMQAHLFPNIVRVLGMSGIAFLILLMNSLFSQWIQTKQKKVLFWIFVLSGLLLLGTIPIKIKHTEKSIKVALVQHNFTFQSDWRFAHKKEVLSAYEEAIRKNAGSVDLIAFPQFGLPVDVLREPAWLEEVVRETKTSVMLGTYVPRIPGESLLTGERFNIALVFSPDQPIQKYTAVTPPPFRHIGQVRGTERKLLQIKDVPSGMMLCYEDAVPEETRIRIQHGAEILFALSNPGHFLGTLLPYYHLLQDQIRAIETGRYVVRISPNGFSAIIDPNGKMTAKSNLNEAVILKGEIYPLKQKTIYSKTGEVLLPLSALICFVLFLSRLILKIGGTR